MAHVSLRGLPPHRLRANRAPIPPRRASALPTHTSADPRARAYVRARAGGWRACARGRGVRGAAAIPPRGLGAAANTHAPFPSHPATPTLLPPPTHRPTHPTNRPPPDTRPAARPLARSPAGPPAHPPTHPRTTTPHQLPRTRTRAHPQSHNGPPLHPPPPPLPRTHTRTYRATHADNATHLRAPPPLIHPLPPSPPPSQQTKPIHPRR